MYQISRENLFYSPEIDSQQIFLVNWNFRAQKNSFEAIHWRDDDQIKKKKMILGLFQ